YATAGDACAGVTAGPEDRIVLAPGQDYAIEVDFSEPRWHVTVNGESGEIGRLAGSDAFRMVYRAPVGREGYWEGDLPSSAFTAFRLLD
ncbi:MAG: hypothetical protein GWM90_16860, partial [Gemmatimonadetes bacterium]|nr:hypothetical protein [Gemmatimonadota bacterium]NIU76165.1 hypothetical protein [Gammaproteobacteria bacterium]NIW38532.1 hypothetical protein [Gemmatimonadota bacterium]NIX45703.1 hypothetical protein [Gemmatimonadota bacterium]NIY10019.1 hypothetical protein [Gemmatimonadota bacterium]